MSTFTYIPSYGAAVTQEPRVRRMSFGDGYEQRAAFGINRQPRKWQLSFRGRTATEAALILGFFQTAAGVSNFSWTPPVGTAGKWVCRAWTQSIVEKDINDIEATFEEVFEA
jgi:phage-related protein